MKLSKVRPVRKNQGGIATCRTRRTAEIQRLNPSAFVVCQSVKSEFVYISRPVQTRGNEAAHGKMTLAGGSVSLPFSQNTGGFGLRRKKNGMRGKKNPMRMPCNMELPESPDCDRDAV